MKSNGGGRPAGALRVVLVTDPATLTAAAQDWAQLLSRSVSNRPTQSPLWLMAWWRIFGNQGGRQLAAALVYDGPRLVGLAPLLRRLWWHRGLIPYRRLELLATGEEEADEIASDYLGLVAEAGYEERVVETVASALGEGGLGAFDDLVLSMMEADLAVTAALTRALEAQGMTVTRKTLTPSPYIPLPASWDAYLAALPSSRRYVVTRSLRDFEKWAGADAEMRRVSTTADLEEGKRILVELHEHRWQAAGEQGVFASRAFKDFHDAVLHGLLEQNALELVWLVVRGKPVAVVYSIVWNNRVMFYQGGRAVDVPKGVRPGIVLHARCIRAAIEAGRIEYDFLPGTSQYKMQLATASRPLAQLRATRAPLRDLACLAIERGVSFVQRHRGARQPS